MDNLSLWLVFTISTAAAVIVGLIAQFFIAPAQKKKILERSRAKNISEKPSQMENGFTSGLSINTASTVSVNAPVVKHDDDETEENVNQLFNFLQIIAAVFSSFAHGGNDVSNAIGPLIAIWLIYVEGVVESTTESPIWILLYGGVGIVLGLWCFGERVIKTLGTGLSKITPAT